MAKVDDSEQWRNKAQDESTTRCDYGSTSMIENVLEGKGEKARSSKSEHARQCKFHHSAPGIEVSSGMSKGARN